MFVVGPSYLSLLQSVAARCGLPYASVVFERATDGSPVYGVEVEVPCFDTHRACRSFFFWAPQSEFSGAGYEQAALQAIAFLQNLYGFVVVDYNFQGVVLCRRVARSALAVATRAAGILARVDNNRKDLLMQSQCFMKEVSFLNLFV
ncbi:hypothetical protein BDA96_09G037900 [Sorghum bicolor]|jgi:hypothetical protein|uniref:Uncharacterized protein n=2 Tax=Sorghum bicolor TaxID=4558 RepID=A0A921U2Z2_SORBI|nr:hypothetical protein BDA96_09G037900 [Sorghum bicolor]OQU77365.1 hypothetical protein SORBI_3009G035500 [Sorghum bicolor]